jgi:hypothetical protein
MQDPAVSFETGSKEVTGMKYERAIRANPSDARQSSCSLVDQISVIVLNQNRLQIVAGQLRCML